MDSYTVPLIMCMQIILHPLYGVLPCKLWYRVQILQDTLAQHSKFVYVQSFIVEFVSFSRQSDFYLLK